MHCPDHLQLGNGPCVAVVPFRRRQVHPAHATRGKILSVVSRHAEKRIIGLKNAAFESPDDDPDDVGVEQAPDLLVALFKIAVELNVLLGRFPPPSRFEPCERQCAPGENSDNGDRRSDQPRLALFERVSARLPICKQEALVIYHLVDLRSDFAHGADGRQRRIHLGRARRLDDLVDLAQFCGNSQCQMCGAKALQWIVGHESLKRLALPSHAFVRDAVGLEIGRVQGQ